MYILSSLLVQILSALFIIAGLANAQPANGSGIEPRAVKCDEISKYTVDFFKKNACNMPRKGSTCVFYTFGLSDHAKNYTKRSPRLTSIWKFMPERYYNRNVTDPNNPIRCIMRNARQRMFYFRNMSEAYAYFCNLFAYIMSDYPKDHVPLNGIWGMTEFPTLRRPNNKGEMDYINYINERGKHEQLYWNRTINMSPERFTEYISATSFETNGKCGAPAGAAATFDKGGALPVYW